MSLDLRQILAFLAVADLGSFRRAAERLNTTQPNISARIANLETRLGQRLMQRDAGSVRLTHRGRALIGPARAVAAAVEEMLAAAGDEALYQGVIRLGVAEVIAHTWLRRFLMELRARFENVTVELTVDLSETLGALLAERQLDLALLNGPFTRTVSGALPLAACPHLWAAAPGLAGTEGRLDAAAMARLPILTHARGTAPWRQLTTHFRQAGVAPRLVPATNSASCLQMALDGLGIACLPRAFAAPALAEGRLVRLDYAWCLPDLSFEARYEAETASPYLTAAARLAQQIAAEDRKS